MAILSAAEVLEWALEIERNGEDFYNAVAAKSTDSQVRALFENLAIQEQQHSQTFRRMLEATRGRDIPTFDEDEYQAYLQTALANALFAGPEKGLTLAKQAQDRETALQAAIGFEKDTLLFFYDLREALPQAQFETVSAVIREEKNHLRRLAGML